MGVTAPLVAAAVHDRTRRATMVTIKLAAPSLKERLALDVETRLALGQSLGDSIVADAQTGTEIPLSDADRRELDDRLREDDEHPEDAIPWQTARARLRGQ